MYKMPLKGEKIWARVLAYKMRKVICITMCPEAFQFLFALEIIDL
jgi:hypothetical protein